MRSLVASIAAHRSWANTEDRTRRTAPGREAMIRKFEREIDPEGKLPPAELAKRVQNARSCYYRQLARKSAQARSRRAKVAAPH